MEAGFFHLLSLGTNVSTCLLYVFMLLCMFCSTHVASFCSPVVARLFAIEVELHIVSQYCLVRAWYCKQLCGAIYCISNHVIGLDLLDHTTMVNLFILTEGRRIKVDIDNGIGNISNVVLSAFEFRPNS